MSFTTFPPRALTDLRQAIQNALNTGNTSFGGNDGIAAMISGCLDQIRDRTLLELPTLAALSGLGGEDGKYALVAGKYFYKFDPNASAPLPNTSVQGNGGAWRAIVAAPAPAYIVLRGDSISADHTITHSLDVLLPQVMVYQLQTPGVIAGPFTLDTDYTLEVLSASQVKITPGSTWASDSRYVVVKQ